MFPSLDYLFGTECIANCFEWKIFFCGDLKGDFIWKVTFHVILHCSRWFYLLNIDLFTNLYFVCCTFKTSGIHNLANGQRTPKFERHGKIAKWCEEEVLVKVFTDEWMHKVDFLRFLFINVIIRTYSWTFLFLADKYSGPWRRWVRRHILQTNFSPAAENYISWREICRKAILNLPKISDRKHSPLSRACI